ncbi:MAG: transposase [Campylobacterales bacterium]|nr:transposase [Campylobacterales bacterium]
MPRIARGETVGGIYHLINRGNMRMQVFDDAEDYEYFFDLLAKAKLKERVELHAYALMPNHFHLLLSPQREGSLSRFMQWVMTSHVRHYHKKNKTSGHIWQGRYKSFLVQQESYYVTLLHYIEANALRAGLVKKAEEYMYASLHERIHHNRALLHEPYVALGSDWIERVNTALSLFELERVRNSVNRQSPLGDEAWQIETAQRLGLMATLNARGRPKVIKLANSEIYIEPQQ